MRLSYSVLEMLGLGYVIAVVCVLFLSLLGQILATAIFLVGYLALQMFVPVPGHEWGKFQPGGLLSDWLYDQTIGQLGHPWSSPWGRGFPFLPMWTHAATTMLGVFASYVITGWWWNRLTVDGRSDSRATAVPTTWDPTPPKHEPLAQRSEVSVALKLRWLIALSIGCFLVGWLWSYHLPIVKNRWTSTFVLWCGGWSYLLLALFGWTIDKKGWRRGFGLWKAIGCNSILAYFMASTLMGGFDAVAGEFIGGLNLHISDYWFRVVFLLVKYALAWAVLVHLWRCRIFLRL